MRINKKNITLAIFGFLSWLGHTQQDAQYTQYMYNTLIINPAYAGSKEALSITSLYRNQWTGLDGAPVSINASIHSPVGNNVGLGFSIIHDEIFISQETYINADFSYTLKLGEEQDKKLAFGINAGLQVFNVDSNRANTGAVDATEGSFNVSNFSPQIGFGLYYYTSKGYIGLSAPTLLETEFLDEDSVNNGVFTTATERATFYGMFGYVFDLSENIKFKPASLVKLVSGAPLQVDISANFLFNEKFILGAAYRWSAAFSGMTGFQLSDKLLLGFAYDIETTELERYNNGSFELFLVWDIFNNKKGLVSPRFF